ncbi:hypothetical protein [Halomonas sp. 25-S5]|uniref:hypothetical protein n=1 Tax=Halomonas sp. 25-S5 TaxID=2994065 RepID=UPI002468C97E|nr:hypothetical protein [Halomonas sp. 25-S5]
MTRPRHSKKDIEAALVHAEAQGWRIEPASGHAWGRLYCPHNDSECRCGEFCIVSVWSRQLRRVVDNCTGGTSSEEDET